MYDEIIRNGTELTDWEDEFIESIGGRIDSGWILSNSQHEVLERIYTDKTP